MRADAPCSVAISPETAVFIDDVAKNAAAAAALGLHGVHFRSPEQLRGELVARLASVVTLDVCLVGAGFIGPLHAANVPAKIVAIRVLRIRN